MKKRTILFAALLSLVAGMVIAQSDDSKKTVEDSVAAIEQPKTDQVVAYYFHGERRCETCMKLEAYSQEAIEDSFADRLADSSLVWRVVNFEADENEHYAEHYELYSQAVILSRVRDGKEVRWRNLDKIWEKVGDKEDFLAYIRTETHRFLDEETD